MTTAVVRDTVPVTGVRDFFDTAFRVLPQVIAVQGAAVQLAHKDVEGLDRS